MTPTQMGYLVLIAALGMILTLLSGDVAHLEHWGDALDPAFMAGVMTHLGAVIAAFVGGKLIPTAPDPNTVDLSKVGKP